MRLLELYTSVQGEGPNVGKRTTFVRFAGCNYRCPGWPCDTPYSIYPKQWKQEYEEVNPEALVDRITRLGPTHICITGGEPLIQPKAEMQDLIKDLRVEGYTIDIFTNGSQSFEMLPARHGVSIIMDWKLQGSGEGDKDRVQRYDNLTYLGFRDAVKFVVKDDNDLYEMKETISGFGATPYQVYVSPAWGVIQPDYIVKFLEDKNLNILLNLQTHKYIWDPAARGI